jgi:hypothetical protein
MKTGFFVGVGTGLLILLFPWIPVYAFPGSPKASFLDMVLHAFEQSPDAPVEVKMLFAGTIILIILSLGGIGMLIGSSKKD